MASINIRRDVDVSICLVFLEERLEKGRREGQRVEEQKFGSRMNDGADPPPLAVSLDVLQDKFYVRLPSYTR